MYKSSIRRITCLTTHQQEHYSITPIPINIISNSPKSGCNDSITNPYQPQPQASSPPSVQPWLGKQYPITLTMSVTETVTDTDTVSGVPATYVLAIEKVFDAFSDDLCLQSHIVSYHSNYLDIRTHCYRGFFTCKRRC